MNKKPLIIIIAGVLIIAIAVCGVIFIPKLLNNTPSGDESISGDSIGIPEMGDGKEFFKITDISEVEPLATKYGFKMEGPEYDAGMVSVYDANCCGIPVQFEFVPHGNEETETGFLMTMSCYYIPFSEEYKDNESPSFTHSGVELKSEFDVFFEMIEKVFNVSVENNYFVIASDGNLLSNSDASSYDQIISNNAFLDFSLRDVNGDYWNLRSETTDEGLVFLRFTNYYDSEQYAENIVHVTVQ